MEQSNNTELLNEINNLRDRINQLENRHHHQNQNLYEPTECDICHKIFRNKYIMKTHKQNMHNDNRERFNCPHCNKTFASKYYLKNHIDSKHKNENANETANIFSSDSISTSTSEYEITMSESEDN